MCIFCMWVGFFGFFLRGKGFFCRIRLLQGKVLMLLETSQANQSVCSSSVQILSLLSSGRRKMSNPDFRSCFKTLVTSSNPCYKDFSTSSQNWTRTQSLIRSLHENDCQFDCVLVRSELLMQIFLSFSLLPPVTQSKSFTVRSLIPIGFTAQFW